jgi:ABC-type transport system substrate-binding protein
MIAVVGGSEFKSWGPTTWEFSLGSAWMVGGQGGAPKGHTLEKLFEIRDIDEAPYFEYTPVLATGYTVEEYWPSEENSFGWNNTGGFRVINITLRENVIFHDGSEWNATVAKWNIDRAYVLTGNLTGSEGAGHSDIMGHMTYKPGIDYKDFYTPSWNHSYTYSNDPVNGLPQAPQYYGKDNDPNKSWTNVSKTLKDGSFPVFNKTLVVKSADETASGTGGTIQIELNAFSTDLRLIAWIAMISMEQYSDMFYTQIQDIFDWTGDQLACGTGTYEAVEVDKTNQIMKLERFDDYWNFTGLRAAGKMIVKEGLISYITGDTDGQLVTTVMTSGDADFALDGPYGEIFEEQLQASPLIEYTDTGTADSIEQLDFILPNTDAAFRIAVSYAFNYTKYLVSIKEGKAIRCDNLMGENSVYINHSIVGSYLDLAIARNALLNDPTYGSVLNFAGIDGSSTTAEWNTFADNVGTLNATSKELFTFNYLHDIYNVDFTSILETSIADIGMVFNKSGATPANPYGDWKTLSLWGMWYPMLFDRQAQYDADLEAFYVDWPMPKTDLAYLDAFYTYKNIYYGGTWSSIPDTWNWGLINDPVLQESIRALYFQNETTKLTTYSTIQERVGTELYTSMFISQDNQGYAANKKYTIGWYWGGFDFAEVSIGPGYETAGIQVAIPGFSLITLLGVVGISILTIGMKKRKKF